MRIDYAFVSVPFAFCVLLVIQLSQLICQVFLQKSWRSRIVVELRPDVRFTSSFPRGSFDNTTLTVRRGFHFGPLCFDVCYDITMFITIAMLRKNR